MLFSCPELTAVRINKKENEYRILKGSEMTTYICMHAYTYIQKKSHKHSQHGGGCCGNKLEP